MIKVGENITFSFKNIYSEHNLQVHEVEDDITSCRTELMTKCRDVTVGYVTKPECDEVR